MYVYLQAYQQGAEAVQPMLAFVTFYRGNVKAFETSPLSVTEGMNNRLRTTPIRFSFSLDALDPGEYLCQVSVLEPNGRKAAFWQTPVMLVP
jgi:hypothetical protein